MADSPAAFAVRDARKAFGARRALDGASFELRRGEFLALLGPNGAGKTTLIRALCGRARLDSGEITQFGLPWKPGGDRALLGFVPQDLALYVDLTAEENLTIFGRLHGVTGGTLRERIRRALDWSGLAERAGEFTHTFSGGMKRRLNIACAVLHQPQVILLDEPTVGVDPQSRERIFDMLTELRGTGASILLTTHQLEDAETRCDRIVILDHGRVVAAGSVAELIAATVGAAVRATVRLDRPPRPIPAGCLPTAEARTLTCALPDPAADVPQLFARFRDAGYVVEEFHTERPSLQAVFLAVTGKELRE